MTYFRQRAGALGRAADRLSPEAYERAYWIDLPPFSLRKRLSVRAAKALGMLRSGRDLLPTWTPLNCFRPANGASRQTPSRPLPRYTYASRRSVKVQDQDGSGAAYV
jgi:hypothetical protein